MRDTNDQIITIPLDKGLDQRKPPHLSPIGTFDIVRNLRVSGTGLLRKRPGTRAIGGTSLSGVAPPLVGAGTATDPAYRPCFLASVGRVGIFGHTSGTVFACDNENTETFYPSGQFSTCEPIQRRLGIMGRELDAGGVGAKCPTVAAISGYVLVAAIDENENLFAYIETEAGARIYVKRAALSATTTITRVRAVALGASFYLFWLTGNAIRVQQLTPAASSVTVGVETSLSSSIINSGYFDVAAGTSDIFILYQLSSGSLRLHAGLAGTTVDFSVTGTVPCSVSVVSGNVWLGWHDDPGVTGDVRYAVRDEDDITIVVRAPATIVSATTYGPPLFAAYWENPTTTVFYCFRSIASSFARSIFFGRAYTSGTIDTPKELAGVYPISKPDGEQRVWVIDDALAASSLAGFPAFCRVTLIRLLDAGRNVAGTVEPQLSVELASPRQVCPKTTDSPSTDPGFFCEVAVSGNSTNSSFFAFPFNVASRDDSTLARIEVYEYRAELEVGARCPVGTAPLGSLTAIAGQPHEVFAYAFPQVTISSGTVPTMRLAGATEIGFAENPIIVLGAAAAGSGLSVGTYRYRAVIEWVDMYGRRHQSAPSNISTVTATASLGAGSVLVREEQLSQRIASLGQLTPPYVVLYRTEANGVIFHRLPGTVTPGVAFSDTASDDDIEDEEILYTEGGVLENVLAPSCRFMRYVAGRLWCGGLWEAEVIECSKLAVPSEQIAFTGDATHQVILDAPCTGLAALDDQLIAFSKSRIQAVVGEGPNDQGVGSFAVRTISSGIGCIDHKSILETDIGVFFQSSYGWYLLPRGLGPPQYVGEFFQTDEASHTDCRGTAIRHGESGHLAMFLLNDVASSDQIVLVYDLASGQWTTDTYPENFAIIGTWPNGFVFCAAGIPGTLSGNPIYIEDPDTIGDGATSGQGTHITATIRTNWIKPSGPAGWGQFKNATVVLQPLAASQTISMSLQVDANTAESLPASVSNGITLDPAFRQIIPQVQKGVGLRVTLSDAAVSAAAALGFQYVAIALEYFPDGGIRPPIPGER